MLYLLSCLIGIIATKIYYNSQPDKLDTQIYEYLRQGHQVVISVSGDATIMSRVGNKMRITKAYLEVMEEGNYERNALTLVDNGPDKSDSDSNVDNPIV